MRFIESDLPKGLRVHVQYIHPGNSDLRPGEYITRASVVDFEGRVISQATAHCHPKKDTPSRKRGREIAVGRALKNALRSGQV